MRRLLPFLTILALALPTAALASGEGWHPDFDEAAKLAKESGKDIIVDFTGSDWCGWCTKLDNEVFKHDAFLTYAKKNFVLVALDFPRGEEAKAKVPNPARNEELKNKYGVRGFPTILLVNADGQVYGQTGYQPGGPEKYVAHLEELRSKFRPGLQKALDTAKTVAAATGDAKVKAVEAALAMMEEVKGAPYAAALIPAAKAALEIDPDNAKGLRNKALVAILDSGKADDATLKAVEAADPKNEAGLYEKAVDARLGMVRSKEQLAPAVEMVEALIAAGPIQDREINIRLHANVTFWCSRFLNDPVKAKQHAEALKALNPENPRLQDLIKKVLGE